MDSKTIDEATVELKRQILLLESMIQQYKDEMMKNYKMIENIKNHIVRTNSLLVNIRKIMTK